MAATLALVPPLAPEPALDPETEIARNLIAVSPEIAARLTAALLKGLDAGVAAILRASGPC